MNWIRPYEVLLDKAYWRVEKTTRPPGMDKTMLHSSLRSLFQIFMDALLLAGANTRRISWRRSYQWAGSWMVLVIMPTIQIRTSLMVSHEPSPLSIFLVEIVSLQ